MGALRRSFPFVGLSLALVSVFCSLAWGCCRSVRGRLFVRCLLPSLVSLAWLLSGVLRAGLACVHAVFAAFACLLCVGCCLVCWVLASRVFVRCLLPSLVSPAWAVVWRAGCWPRAGGCAVFVVGGCGVAAAGLCVCRLRARSRVAACPLSLRRLAMGIMVARFLEKHRSRLNPLRQSKVCKLACGLCLPTRGG